MGIQQLDEEAIFNLARKIASPPVREGYLQQVCGENDALRARVHALLNVNEEERSLPEHAVGGQGPTLDEPISECPGTLIGPYKLMEQIGEGGMGLVFVAEQQQPVRRKVALKVIKPGMDTRQVVARFEAERQALALMDHPNIAKVHDGGETGSGRPYFVMELVKGVPITEYCDQNQVPIRERLELFLHVCQAVQHAHQKGIIHRDIKPSNVLIMSQDGTPLVKVIDFGVAKAVGQQLTDKTIYTQFTQLVGTPLYMSPEQAGQSGLDVDTRTDIYALGVLLYELLTGTTPFDKERLSKASYDEIRRIIREEEPPKPSTRISTLGQAATTVSTNRKSDQKRLSQLFRGELDWIVMKALDKDRNRRYETASAFAADVQRYLHDEPVLACPPSAWYRFRKFTRRKKTALAVAACVFLALAGIAGSIGWAVRDKGAREEGIERDRLAREEALDQAVERSLEETGALMKDGKWSEALEAVKRADKLLAAAGRTERPARLLELKKDLIMAERLEGIYRGPTRHLKASFVGSSEYGTEYPFQAQPDSSEEESFSGRQQDGEFAMAFQDLGMDIDRLEPAEAATQIGQRSIRSALLKALDEWALLRTRARPGGLNDPGWKKLVEIARQADSDPWRNRCRESLLRRDRQALEQLANAVPIRQVEPATLYQLGHTLKEVGALDKAMDLLRRAQHEYPDDVWINDALAFFSWNACQPPRYDDALRFYAAVLALRPRFARTHLSVADALKAKGALQEALVEYSRAIELEPKNIHAWMGRGQAYRNLRQYDKAVADFSKAIELDPKNPWTWRERGWAYRDARQYEKSLADSTKAIEVAPKDVHAWINRGHTYRALHQYDKALSDYDKAAEIEPKEAWTYHGRVWLYIDMGQYDKALADANKAIELNPKSPDHWHMRAAAYRALGQYHKALADHGKTIELAPAAWTWTFAAWAERDVTYDQLREHDNKTLAPARLHVRLSQWDDAAAAYARVNWSGRLHDDAFEYACLFLVRGDKEGYEKFCRQMIERAGLTKDPFEFYVLARTCAMTPQGVVDPAQSVQWAKQALAGYRVPWFVHALGLAQYRAGQFDAALQSFNEALVGRWNFSDYCWLCLALVHQRLGHAAEARECLEKGIQWLERATSKNPQQPVSLMPPDWLGAQLLVREVAAMVIAECSKCLERDPKDAEGWNNRGHAYFCLHQYGKAIDNYSKAIELQPKNAVFWTGRGAARARMGQGEKGLADYAKAIELDAKNASAWWGRGQAYFDLGKWSKAAEDFSKVLELEPHHVQAWSKRGLAYANLGQADKASADFAEMWPLPGEKDQELWASVGNGLRHLGRFDEAIRQYTKAIELNPQQPEPWYQRGQTRLLKGEWNLAVADFSATIERAANVWVGYTARAAAYTQLGQFAAALADYEKVRELTPESGEALNNLAWFLATCPEPKFRDPKRAVELAKKAVELTPKEGNFWNTLGAAHYRAKNWKEAVAALEKSMQLRKGGDSFDFFFLAMTYWQLGHKDEALKWYKQAVEWMQKNGQAVATNVLYAEELSRFRAEAKELLGIKEKKD